MNISAEPFIMLTSAHPLTAEQMPTTLGHEISESVTKVGSEITDIQKETNSPFSHY
jgi:Zn-dependent alcohol dehydrogenase